MAEALATFIPDEAESFRMRPVATDTISVESVSTGEIVKTPIITPPEQVAESPVQVPPIFDESYRYHGLPYKDLESLKSEMVWFGTKRNEQGQVIKPIQDTVIGRARQEVIMIHAGNVRERMVRVLSYVTWDTQHPNEDLLHIPGAKTRFIFGNTGAEVEIEQFMQPSTANALEYSRLYYTDSRQPEEVRPHRLEQDEDGIPFITFPAQPDPEVLAQRAEEFKKRQRKEQNREIARAKGLPVVGTIAVGKVETSGGESVAVIEYVSGIVGSHEINDKEEDVLRAKLYIPVSRVDETHKKWLLKLQPSMVNGLNGELEYVLEIDYPYSEENESIVCDVWTSYDDTLPPNRQQVA